MNMLMIDDNVQTATSFQDFMKNNNINIDLAFSGEEGVQKVLKYPKKYNAIIIDVKLPDISGHEVINILSHNNVKPILIAWTGSSTQDDVVQLWSSGKVTDVMKKPTSGKEMIARLRSHIFNRPSKYNGNIIKIGKNMTFNYAECEVYIHGKRLKLSASEHKLFECLVLHRNTLVTKAMIMDYLYPGNPLELPQMKIIDVLLCKIRKKIANFDPVYQYVRTKWSSGYSLLQDPLPIFHGKLNFSILLISKIIELSLKNSI